MVFLQFPFKSGLKCVTFDTSESHYHQLRLYISSIVESDEFVLYYNGKKLQKPQLVPSDATIHVAFPLPGGKGGFGSMLRAIGAQIEKTTNREACRDLSGRRLRDINEEQRLKKWISKESEREAEKARRRQARIERLKTKPKHNFVDFDYEKEISALPERIDDALIAGLQKVGKRPAQDNKACSAASSSKRKKVWVNEDFSDSSDSDSDTKKASTSSDSSCKFEPDSDSQEVSNLSTTNAIAEQSSLDASSKSPEIQALKEKSQFEVSKPFASIEGESSSCSKADDPCKLKISDESESTEGKKTSESAENRTDGNEANISKMLQEKTINGGNKSTANYSDNQEDASIDLLSFQSSLELEELGLDRLKSALMSRGLKCGGSLSDRAQRLWKVRSLQPHEYPSNLLAKKK